MITIPKIFHWIWLGPKPLPERYRLWIDGWLKLHPGWEHKLWTDANRPQFVNEAQFVAADNFTLRSDIARYEIVYRYGGVYVDTDTECLRSIEPLLDCVKAFAVEAGEPHTIETTPIGAVPKHPWLADVIAKLPRAMETGWGNMHRSGPKFLTDVTQHWPEVVIFSELLFPSISVDETKRTNNYTLHHCGRSWDAASRNRYEDKLQEMLQKDIEPVVPPGAVFILVDKGRGHAANAGRRAIPFPERNGEWAGYPPDDAAAIAELDRLRRAGAQFIVFPAPMVYWLDNYCKLRDHLHATARCVVDNDRAVIFDLHA